MTDPNATPEPATPIIKARRTRISWIWLVPIVAALIGLSLLIRGWMSIGPVVTISFQAAEGIEVGQTKVRYKDVVVGLVSNIRVAEDRSGVLVKVQLNREGSRYFTQEEAKYWVVRPRLDISGVSGLGTLLSGPYISVDAPKTLSDAPAVYDFVGLEKPPEIATDRPGRRYHLTTADLGSLEVGSPVYFRRIPVGRVIDYALSSDGRMVDVQIFIDAPNDKYVTTDARFWNVSGVDVSLSASGFSIRTGSLASVIAGGVAFAPASLMDDKQAPANASFVLSANESDAMADPDGVPFRVDMLFHQSVRGLKVGAPVDFRGMVLGQVYDIDLQFDDKTRKFYTLVKVHLYPMRFGGAYERMVERNPDYTPGSYPGQLLLAPMIRHGLRAQMQASNLLTGQQFISLDFFPKAEPVDVDPDQHPIQLPTILGNFDRLQEQISSIVTKLDAIPFEGIGNDLQASLKEMKAMLATIDKKIAPQLNATLKAAQVSLDRAGALLALDSPLNSSVENTLRELNNAANSLRMLSDSLQANPSALLRGQPADVLPD